MGGSCGQIMQLIDLNFTYNSLSFYTEQQNSIKYIVHFNKYLDSTSLEPSHKTLKLRRVNQPQHGLLIIQRAASLSGFSNSISVA